MKLLTGDSRDKLKELEDNSIDSLVTDPPYLINFMGKDWDKENSPAGDSSFWEEVLRVMKPGAHGLVFGHSRQHHRVMAALEDAGFEIRDCLMWLYGSGFPKNHNIGNKLPDWEGWGTALKPAYEPIILVRKPVEKKLTIAKNVLKHGTGGLNIDASRIGTEKILAHHSPKGTFAGGEPDRGSDKNYYENEGRFPANILLDPVSAEMLDKQASSTGASRFFYCAKVGKKERNVGCDDLEANLWKHPGLSGSVAEDGVSNKNGTGTVRGYSKNDHPTVKPIKLMTYLAKLITPEGGVVLDPFMGSGSTGMACALEGFDFVGIEMDEKYVNISQARIQWAREEKKKSE